MRRIIDGVYPAGSRLPTERHLAAEFGTARSVVREALKRIEALNLVVIRQGSGAVVQDFQTSGGIELADLLLVESNGGIDETFLKDVAQFHEAIHIWLVRLVAQRITSNEIDCLKRLLMERALNSTNQKRLTEITMEISRQIVQAAHNRYLNLLFNTLARTARVSRIVFEMPVYFDPAIQTFFERLVDSFENRDPEMAALLTARIFKNNRDAFAKAVGLFAKSGESEKAGLQHE